MVEVADADRRARADIVVVLTLADAGDAFAKETAQLREQLAEARRISARQERVITPTGETEIAAIVRHRLFSHIDETVAREAVRFYADAYRPWSEQNVALPQRALRAEYAQEIADDYPFHPELLNTLNRKVSTIPNFQKTRGALRLLALVVRQLWEQRPADTWLIHPHHVSLVVPAIVEDLTSRLERPAFKQVIEADIASPKKGSPAHAQILDRAWVDAGKAPYTRHVATAVFLHSLTQGIASGVDPADLLLAVLAPGDEPLLVHKAAELLYDKGWFFEWDGHRYRFKTEPSLNKIVTDEMGMVGRTKAKKELDSRIRQVWKSGIFKAEYFRQEAGEVDDDAGLPKLVVLHYDAATATAAEPIPPELVRKIADYAGTLEAYRRFRNNLVFLVADDERVDEMVQTAQRYLAIARITGDAERMAEFTAEQRTKLKKMGEAAELDVRVAITRDDLGAPDWSAEVVYGGLPVGASCAGLAVVRDPASAVRYLLAVAADGGYLVDPQTSDRIQSLLLSTSSLRSIANVVQVEATSFETVLVMTSRCTGRPTGDRAKGLRISDRGDGPGSAECQRNHLFTGSEAVPEADHRPPRTSTNGRPRPSPRPLGP